jgi:uncharacterized protein (TIGR02246 family)
MNRAHEGEARSADLAAIRKLHQADIDATMTQDLNALTTLWSDDAVNLGFPGPSVVGIKAMREAYEKFKKDYPEFQVLRYANEMKQVQTADGWAIEMSDSEATFKMSAGRSGHRSEGARDATAEAAERRVVEIRRGWSEIIKGRTDRIHASGNPQTSGLERFD